MSSGQTDDYNRLQSLPFADGKFENTPKFTETISFTLAKNPERKVSLFSAHSPDDLPNNLIDVLYDEFNYVVDEGRTYPHYKLMTYEEFTKYCFECYTAVLIEGDFESPLTDDLIQQPKSFWKDKYLGHFYIKPNYIGRCSHVCNAGFIVNHEKRNMGIGKEMGTKYLIIAPKLGFIYSVFNLVFETNTASSRIWDGLGFDRIGYVKNVAVLKGETQFTGAIMYGKDLV